MVVRSTGFGLTSNLSEDEISGNFADMHPPLDRPQALIEADRCYFCYDAPCITACPTGIDIPEFIQQIRSGNTVGSARTILQENIMGGMCARVCPTEILCEQACVRNTHEEKPVEIGLLQRHATDPIIKEGRQLFERAQKSTHKVAVVGAGPAGISCAHRLAMLGHEVVVFDANAKPGGLNEYGLAAYKTVNDFAQDELDYILEIGGITIENGINVGSDTKLADIRDQFDATFLGIGLPQVNDLGVVGGEIEGIVDAVDYIAELRQAKKKSTLPVGNNVVVIGGGMTAIDIAVQSKMLGAQSVTIAYRRGPNEMGASDFEQRYANTKGVAIEHWLSPSSIHEGNGKVIGVEFGRTAVASSGFSGSGSTKFLAADVVFRAIGQTIDWETLGDIPELVAHTRTRIEVDKTRQTSLEDVWAGGDCIVDGENLTVSAVQDGKIAAINIDRYLRQRTN
jgi:dihydropyrimidine dehydrogenase (NAD+) subunit PreT